MRDTSSQQKTDSAPWEQAERLKCISTLAERIGVRVLTACSSPAGASVAGADDAG